MQRNINSMKIFSIYTQRTVFSNIQGNEKFLFPEKKFWFEEISFNSKKKIYHIKEN